MSVRQGFHLGIAIVSLVALAGPLWAAGSTVSEDSGPLLLRPPGPGAGPLAVPTTGMVLLPGVPRELRHLSIGINDLGGQLRLHLSPRWAAEGRFLTGSASSDVGDVHANVFGVRGYRFFSERHRFRLYAGLEGDYVHTSLESVNTANNPNSVATISGFGDTSGYAMGAFGGMEFRLLRRVAIDFDVGPYMIGLKEKVTGVSDASLDFVANTAINVYLF